MQSLAQKIGVKYDLWMQDWPLEVADRNRISEFIERYKTEENADHRQLLAELIVASLDELFELDAPGAEILCRAANTLRNHDDVLDYWSCDDATESEQGFAITSWIRSVRALKASDK